MFDDIDRWVRGDGLEIVLLAIGALLLTRAVNWSADRYGERLTRTEAAVAEGGGAPSDLQRQRRALMQALPWAINAVVWLIAGLLVLERLGVPLSLFVGPAAVTGVALGFGAQQMVQDVLSGFFILSERQYAVGDIIRISQPGEETGIDGTVEEVTLRVTRLRRLSGEVVIVPNGEIRQVTNLSRDWARVLIDIPLAPEQGVDEATEVLHDVADDFYEDEHWKGFLLDKPSVLGVETIDMGFVMLRFVARTQPAHQFEVGRELRRRISVEFQHAGVRTTTSLLMTRSGGA